MAKLIAVARSNSSGELSFSENLRCQSLGRR